MSDKTAFFGQQIQSLQLQLQQEPPAQAFFAQQSPPPLINFQIPAPDMAYPMLPPPFPPMQSYKMGYCEAHNPQGWTTCSGRGCG